MGIPIKVVITSRQAALISTLRQDLRRMVMAIVVAAIAVSGVAKDNPTTIVNNGIAINASPNPNDDLMKVDKRIIAKTRIVVVDKSIDLPDVGCLSI